MIENVQIKSLNNKSNSKNTMINTDIKEIDASKIERARNISNKVTGIFLLEEFLGGFEGKYILDIGCGTGIEPTKVGEGYYPDIAETVSGRGGLVYGLDPGFINKSKSYLELFRKKTGIIPISGGIEHIDEVLEGKQFDSMISTSVMGKPTETLDWNGIMKKLYSLTKPNGYHYHLKLKEEKVNIDRTSLEEMGFTVLSDFRKNDGLGSALFLHKGYS